MCAFWLIFILILRYINSLILNCDFDFNKITNNILSELDEENKDFINLVRAEGEDSFDKKIQTLKF